MKKNSKVILTNVYVTNQPDNNVNTMAEVHNINTVRDIGNTTGGLLSKRKSLTKK